MTLNSKRKILFVNHTSDLVGGAEDDFERLLRYFSQKKEKYCIDALFPEGPRSTRYAEYCDKCFHYKWGIYPVIFDKLKGYVYYLVKSFIQFNALHKQFKNKNYDICIINVAVLLWPALYFKMKKSKIIFFIRETVYPDFSRKIYYRLISRLGDFFFSVSDNLKNDFIRITGNTNIRTVYSAIENVDLNISEQDLRDYVSDENYSKIKSKKEFKFLNIGMISRRKNQTMILRALDILNKRPLLMKPVVFFIGKFGNEKDYVNEFDELIAKYHLEQQIVLLGELKREVYYKIAANLDSYIISSLSEGMPIVLVEAFKFRKPVISTKVGGVEDVIQDMQTGILVDLNERALADAMGNLMSNPELTRSISAKAHEIYSEKFNLNNNLSVINEVVGKLTAKAGV